ncbi:MAG TPA: methyltransferase domain-containing protein [Bryobacteraceae bacterium]|nr:methyltransferase domain-containing protein [Bryobacteraceae bacterium]
MPEFTGERVIPGLVDTDLLNEHLARYRFAARFLGDGAAVLDAGCGCGYGSAELSRAASLIGADISADAVQYASANYAREGVRFLQSACEAMPFADASFDLMTAFEVIEHLERWPELLREARRVLRPTGVLVVSTPNKAYYTESRGEAGPNPFHCHEFEYEEFQKALREVFPHVRLWTQNHAEAMVFAPLNPSGTHFEAQGDARPEQAHFFIAACSLSPIEGNELYAWMPSSANILRERERHIEKLTDEVARRDAELARLTSQHRTLQQSHEEAINWARGLDAEIKRRDAVVVGLQKEAEERLRWIRGLEDEIAEGHTRIERITAELLAQAQELDQLRPLPEQLRLVAQSKWVRLGRKLNLGPVVSTE